MGTTTYCCGLHPRGAVYLIAIVDIILSLIFFLLSSLALADLHKVATYIERDEDVMYSTEDQMQKGINEFTHLHGQVVLLLLGNMISLLLAVGLFLGVKKDVECPIKAWLINGCVFVLLGVISMLVVTIVTARLAFMFLMSLILIRIYEIWVVFDFLRSSRFTPPPLTRTLSTERLHSV